MTRAVDVETAVAVGARYVGVVFAAGLRTVSVDTARDLMRRVPSSVGRVGVFGPNISPRDAGDVARAVGLDVVQLHADPNEAAVSAARAAFSGAVWAVVRVRDDSVSPEAVALFQVADAVVLDAYSPHALGGTGLSLRWREVAANISAIRRSGKLVLAGGLRTTTVAEAVRTIRPDIVDVSSGVESAPGIKDHEKLRAFKAAVDSQGTETAT